MKIQSLKSITILSLVLLVQIGCTLQENTDTTKEQYSEAIILRNRANFLQHEGYIDSAIAYYRKSISICFILERKTDTAKDTTYKRKIAHLYFDIGYIYDSIDNYDSALMYLRESLKWAVPGKAPKIQISDEYFIGHVYYKDRKNYAEGSIKRKEILSNSILYLRKSLVTLDSLSFHKNKFTLILYLMLKNMYKETGDSANKHFFDKQYNDLSSQLSGH